MEHRILIEYYNLLDIKCRTVSQIWLPNKLLPAPIKSSKIPYDFYVAI